jgi:opacity protein-like surface antigen
MPGARIYIGPQFGWTTLNGDFDGDHVFVNPLTGQVAAVPEFDSGFAYGGVLGLRNTIPHTSVDLAIETSYQEASLNAQLGNFRDFDSKVREINFLFRSYFRSNKSVQPILAAGFGVPWVTIKDGVSLPNNQVKDAEYTGFAWLFGGGVGIALSQHLSLDAIVLYKHRTFSQVNEEDLSEDLNSSSFEPMVSLRYHFFLGKSSELPPSATRTMAPEAVSPAPPAATPPPAAPASNPDGAM